MPDELKDLRGAKEIAIDLETNDPHLKKSWDLVMSPEKGTLLALRWL